MIKEECKSLKSIKLIRDWMKLSKDYEETRKKVKKKVYMYKDAVKNWQRIKNARPGFLFFLILEPL